MAFWKYYDKIRLAQSKPTPRGPGAVPEIDFDKSPGFFARIIGRAISLAIRASLWFFRVFWPNPRLFGLVVVTRAADVREVLKNDKAFQVPFELEMKELGGENTILAMDDCPHRKLRGRIEGLMKPEDLERVRDDTAEVAKALILNSGGRLDVVGDLITRCATESCARFFGLEVDHPVAFADWSTALSQVLFADPLGDKQARVRALYASHRLKDVAQRAIDRARDKQPGADTLVERFLDAQQHDPSLTDALIRATLVGTTTGYIPTTALAAAKMLQVLIKRPEAWRQATEAARARDRGRLMEILMEAGRLNPALFPGQWRYAREAAVIADGKLRRRRVRKGDVVLVATGAALADGRQYPSPRAFKPDRQQCPELMFGSGVHFCIGDQIAKVMLTEVFLHLLVLDDLRPAPDPAGKLRSSGAYPRQWDMVFTPAKGRPPRGQSMVVVCAPLADPKDEAHARRLVAACGNPAGPMASSALKATDLVHFASLTVSDLGDEKKPAPHVLLEINADGPPERALEAIAQAGAAWMGPIFALTVGGAGADLLTVLQRYNLTRHAKPWSTTHLNYNGIEEFPIADIDQQEKLADFCRRAIDHFARERIPLGRRAMAPLRFVRKLIHGDRVMKRHAREQGDDTLLGLMEEAKAFRAFVIQPARRRLKIADWVETSITQARLRTAFSKDARPMWTVLALVGLVLATGIFFATGGLEGRFEMRMSERPAGWDLSAYLIEASAWDVASRLFLSLVAAAFGEALVLALLIWGALLLLRAKERADRHDSRHVDFQHFQDCTANEDAPGYVQNHFIATPTLKGGLFRRLTLALALWGIGTLIVYGFRPGFVLNMGTIHYAKWFRPPGSRRLVFYGNYDGSWESYLEDFITKAHLGQTAGWSNCEGFPPTEYLVGQGARDGDRFKRWVRRQQVPTGFWFSRFPHLTTERVRNNALIHHGLAHAHTDSAARAWLACFNSQQRPESTLETDDIQSLVFHGFGKLPRAMCAVLTLPDDVETCGKWLSGLVAGYNRSVARRSHPSISVTFGDAPGVAARDSATAVAFSAEGLRKLGLPDGGGEAGDGLATFPGAFRLGMSGRARTLGDDDDDAPEHWRWADVGKGDTPGSDAVLLVYAKTAPECDTILKAHLAVLGEGASAYVLPTQPTEGEDLRQEHFGFRDSISQPIIRGTERFVDGEVTEDVLEPGEFILGYRSNQGFFPSSPMVHADTDSDRELATTQAESPMRFPIFAEGPHGSAFHDFGRNGSYLVLRQFEQHVDRFKDFATDAVDNLAATYPQIWQSLGSQIDATWIKAKIVGRWPNGVSLLDRPHFPGHGPHTPDNSFAFGRDDPQGLRCPLGAHARRANPRDSFDPSDKRGREIANRHRLLRRGRAYQLPREGGDERGLLFACLCSDIERQFEFVQQTWINASFFHGLDNQADPLLRGHKTPAFTIPTPTGALQLRGLQRFVTVRGGGYYFLPSRSALNYLVTRCSRPAVQPAMTTAPVEPAPPTCPHARPDKEPELSTPDG